MRAGDDQRRNDEVDRSAETDRRAEDDRRAGDVPEVQGEPAEGSDGHEPSPESASRTEWRSPSALWDEDDEADDLPRRKAAQYTASGPKPPARRSEEPAGGQLQRGETIAFMLLAGVAIGALAGWGIDALVGTFPAFMIVGVFAGFGLALYAVFIETR